MTKRAKGWGVALALAALAGLAGGAWALDPDVDQMTIRITPNVDYGINLDTATAQFDTGDAAGDLDVSLSLNATHYFISPASVTILGNFSNQEVKVTAAGLDTWTVDTDETIEADKVQLYALFALAKSSRPLESEFGQGADGRHQIMFGAADKIAGEPSGANEDNNLTGNVFELPSATMTDGVDMDNLQVGTLRQMWLRLDTPSLTTVDGAQQIQVTVTAVTGTTN